MKLKFPLPKEARQFIRDLDEKKAVKPFRFSTTGKPWKKGTCMNFGFDPNKDRDFSE